MAFGISHTIGVLVRGHNQLTKSLVKAEDSLLSFRRTAQATASAVNRGFASPRIDMSEVNKAAGHLRAAGTKALIFGGLMTAGLGLAVSQATHFQTAMAEVSTLVDTATTDVGALSTTVRGLSREFGETPVSTAKALYTTISAGFGEARQATTLLTGAMKLARGGLAELGGSIDGLTSILNSYGLAADQVTFVSDRMFTAMRLGKTTIGELASSMGAVTPLAATVGVSLDELLASVSALTLGGLGTAEAVTSVRGILTAVVKQTAEAKEVAGDLGIEFSAGAIRAKGFANWLAEVGRKTNGDQEAMAGLFGRVEALTGALALSGEQAGSFASILGEMAAAAGATDTAFGKIDATAGATFKKMAANVTVLRESVGAALLPMVLGLARGITAVAGRLSAFAEAHPLLTQIGATLAGVTAGVLLLGGAALIMGAQVLTAMALVNVSTGGLFLAVGGIVAGVTALTLWLTRSAEAGAESSGVLARSWALVKRAFFAMATPIAFGAGFLVGVLTKAWGAIASFTAEVWPYVAKIVGTVARGILAVLSPPLAAVEFVLRTSWGIVTALTRATWLMFGNTVIAAWHTVEGVVGVGWTVVTGLFKAGLQLLVGDWEGAWATVLGGADTAWKHLRGVFLGWVDWLDGLKNIFVDLGSGLMESFRTGLMAAAERLKNGMLDIAAGLRALLPGSDAKEGPLSTLTAAGRALLPTFARGIEAEEAAPIAAVRSALVPAKAELTLPALDGRAPAATLPATTRSEIQNDYSRTLVLERGAIVIQATAKSVAEDLEAQLERLFERLNSKWGPSHA